MSGGEERKKYQEYNRTPQTSKTIVAAAQRPI
jgi:hypothetical protein